MCPHEKAGPSPSETLQQNFMHLYCSEDKGHSYEGAWGYVPPTDSQCPPGAPHKKKT